MGGSRHGIVTDCRLLVAGRSAREGRIVSQAGRLLQCSLVLKKPASAGRASCGGSGSIGLAGVWTLNGGRNMIMLLSLL